MLVSIIYSLISLAHLLAHLSRLLLTLSLFLFHHAIFLTPNLSSTIYSTSTHSIHSSFLISHTTLNSTLNLDMIHSPLLMNILNYRFSVGGLLCYLMIVITSGTNGYNIPFQLQVVVVIEW